MPDPESLRCFLAAVREANFRCAAKLVALSPAAFGQRIRQLEEELGVQLFERTTRTVMLTESGLRLRPYAERALAALDECKRVSTDDERPPPMELVVGTRHELGVSWLVPMLPALELALPGLTAHLYFGSGDDLVARVRTSDIDCAVTSTRITDPRLDFCKLHEEQYVFVGCREKLEKTPLSRPEDARNHTLLDTAEALPLFRYWRDAEGAIDSMRFAAVRRLGTVAAIRQCVRQGMGVAVLPAYYVQQDLSEGTLVAVLPDVKPASDYFRLVFRSDDPRRGVYGSIADIMLSRPLR